MKYFTFRYIDGRYRKQMCNDEYLSMLTDIFDDGGSLDEYLKKELMDLTSQGITGNMTDVSIDGDTINIAPQFTENSEDFAINIDRHVLLNLINEWQELVAKGAQEITFIRHDDGTITITDNIQGSMSDK